MIKSRYSPKGTLRYHARDFPSRGPYGFPFPTLRLVPGCSGMGTLPPKRSANTGRKCERQISFSTSNYIWLRSSHTKWQTSLNYCQISARHLGLRDLVLQVEDLRFRFASATTRRLKLPIHRGSSRFYRGGPLHCSAVSLPRS